MRPRSLLRAVVAPWATRLGGACGLAADERRRRLGRAAAGEAVALAARLAWSYGVPQPPALEVRAPARTPTPDQAESTPGTSTTP